MTEDILKQVEFAKSHSTVSNAKGAIIFKGKRVLSVGFSHLPLNYRYQSADSKQHEQIHISAVADVIMKIGSYRRVTYSDLDIALSHAPTLEELVLIVEMGFKKMWVVDNPKKGVDPNDYFHETLTAAKIRF